MWLAEFGEDRAVEVLGPEDPPDPRLERLFARVDRCRVTPGRFELAVEDAGADVVVLGDLLPELAAGLRDRARDDARRGDGAAVAILAECRRVLRRGGVAQLSVGNALWHRNLRRRLDPRDDAFDPSRTARPATVRRWIRRSGFERARLLYVSPRSGLPEGLIPSSARALAAHERLRGTASGLRRVGRLCLARTGFGSLLHPRLLALGLA